MKPKKQPTKKQRDREALRQRLADMLYGVSGAGFIPHDFQAKLPAIYGTAVWLDWIHVVNEWVDANNQEVPDWMFDPVFLRHFFTLDSAAEYMVDEVGVTPSGKIIRENAK